MYSFRPTLEAMSVRSLLRCFCRYGNPADMVGQKSQISGRVEHAIALGEFWRFVSV